MFEYKPKGVCAQNITLDIRDNKVISANFTNGCPGNLIGLANLVEGQDIDALISKLEGIKCGRKSTSCPDQLAEALKEYKKNN